MARRGTVQPLKHRSLLPLPRKDMGGLPADTPHQYTEVDGLRALEVRFVTSETRPPAT